MESFFLILSVKVRDFLYWLSIFPEVRREHWKSWDCSVDVLKDVCKIFSFLITTQSIWIFLKTTLLTLLPTLLTPADYFIVPADPFIGPMLTTLLTPCWPLYWPNADHFIEPILTTLLNPCWPLYWPCCLLYWPQLTLLLTPWWSLYWPHADHFIDHFIDPAAHFIDPAEHFIFLAEFQAVNH